MKQLVVSSQTYTSICAWDAFSISFFLYFLHCTLSTSVFATLSARALVLHCVLSAATFLKEIAFSTWGCIKANDI